VLTTYTECNTIAELRSSSAGQFLETTAIVVNAALVPLHTVAAGRHNESCSDCSHNAAPLRNTNTSQIHQEKDRFDHELVFTVTRATCVWKQSWFACKKSIFNPAPSTKETRVHANVQQPKLTVTTRRRLANTAVRGRERLPQDHRQHRYLCQQSGSFGVKQIDTSIAGASRSCAGRIVNQQDRSGYPLPQRSFLTHLLELVDALFRCRY